MHSKGEQEREQDVAGGNYEIQRSHQKEDGAYQSDYGDRLIGEKGAPRKQAPWCASILRRRRNDDLFSSRYSMQGRGRHLSHARLLNVYRFLWERDKLLGGSCPFCRHRRHVCCCSSHIRLAQVVQAHLVAMDEASNGNIRPTISRD